MMKNLIEELINDYLNHGKSHLEEKMRTILNRNATSEQILRLSHPAIESVKLFLEKEAEIITELNLCTTRAEIEKLAHRSFGNICGIGERTIQNWVSHKTYLLDLESEANCSVLLPQKAITQITRQQFSLDQFRGIIIRLHDQFSTFQEKDVDSFLLFVEQKKKIRGFVKAMRSRSV